MVGKTDYSKMKVADLKDLLAERELSQSGAKAALVARLQADDKQKAKKGSKRTTKKKEESESEGSESEKPTKSKRSTKKEVSESEEESEKPKKGAAKKGKKPAKKEESEEESEKPKSKKTKGKRPAKKEDSESEESEKPKSKKTKGKKPAKKEESEEENEKPKSKKTKGKKPAKKEESESDDSESDERPTPKKGKGAKATVESKKNKESEESDDSESEKPKGKKGKGRKSEESEEESEVSKAALKKSRKGKKSAKKEESDDSESEKPNSKKTKGKKSKEDSEESESEEAITPEPVKVKFPKGVTIPDVVYKVPAESLFRIFVKANEESFEMKDLLNAMITALEPYSDTGSADGADGADAPSQEDEKDGGDKVDLIVTWDDNLKVHSDSERRWAFDAETKKVFGKVKDGKVKALSQDDVEALQDPPIDNMGVLSKEKFSEVLKKQITSSSRLDASTDSEGDDGKDVVQKVEGEVKKMLDDEKMEIDEDTFVAFVQAQENVKQKADYMAVAKEADMAEGIARHIMTNYATLKEKYAKALTSLKTKKSDAKSEGRKVRRK